jgi:hypothetical protein
MSYSAVDPVAAAPPAAPWGVSQRLAWSDDGGDSWNDAGLWVTRFAEATAAGDLPATDPEPAIPAGATVVVQHETSTLAHDPADPDTPWKLLWHQVLWSGGTPYFASYAWIALREAATPEGLASAEPVALLGGHGLQTALGTPAIDLTALDPELAGCVFAEPGLLAAPGALYLTIDCHVLGPTVDSHVVLFACASPCAMTEAAGWTYLGRVLTPDDARAVDARYRGFSGTALAARGGATHLLATPVEGDRYDGCLVFRFADLAAGLLERSAVRPLAVAEVRGIPGTHHGACAHHAGLEDGILFGQLVSASPPFRIHRSSAGIP